MTSNQIEASLYLVGIGAFITHWSYKRLYTRRKIEDIPTSRTRSAAQGLSEFQGYAWPLFNTVKCAFNNECVHYSIVLEKYVKRGKRSSWESVYTNVVASDFYLIDPTGAVQVSPEGAEFIIQTRTTNWNDLPKAAQDFMLSNHISYHSSGFPPSEGFLKFFKSNFRVRENYILLGSPLLILGGYDSTAGGEKNLSNANLHTFFEKIKTDVRLKIGTTSPFFDLNKDGKVEADEMRRGLYYMARALIKPADPGAPPAIATPVPLHGLVKKTEDHGLVVIDSHEATYKKENNWFHYFSFLGGVALIVFGFFVALHQLL